MLGLSSKQPPPCENEASNKQVAEQINVDDAMIMTNSTINIFFTVSVIDKWLVFSSLASLRKGPTDYSFWNT